MTKRKSLLTLCMAFVMCLCVGFGFGGSMDTVYAEGETDTRQVISEINATSNINEIVGYGNNVIEPTFNIGSPLFTICPTSTNISEPCAYKVEIPPP